MTDHPKIEIDIATDYDAAGEKEALQGLSRLQNMGKRDLAAEITRLNKARKEAASRGDVETYKALDAQLKTAKSTLRDFAQQAKIAKIATVQQAQAGMQFASTLGGLASAMKSGTASAADLANGVMSLGMAIKAGLGPIGLVMAAVQALSMAWSAYKNKQKAAAEQEKKAAVERRQAVESLRALGSAIGDYWKAQLDKSAEAHTRALDKVHAAEEREANAAREIAQRKADAAREIAEASAAAEEADMRARIARGEASETELTALQRRHAREREKAAADAASAAVGEEANALDLQISHAEERLEELKRQRGEAQNTFGEVWQQADASSLQIVLKQIEGYKAKQAELQRQADEATKYKESLGGITGGLLETSTEYKSAVADEARAHALVKHATNDLERVMRQAAEKLGLSNIDLGKALQAAELKKSINDQIREENAKLKDLQAEREVVSESLELTEDINEAKRKQLTAEEEAVAAEQAAAQSRNAVKSELQRIAGSYALQGSYAQQKAQTEEQALAADRRALQARRAALQNLLATPGLDAATQQEINAALAETQQQIRNYKATVAQGAEAAQRELSKFKAPDIEGANKSLEGNLKRTAKGFEMQARKLEDAARKGDVQGMERAKNAMRRQARSLEAGTGYTEKYTQSMQHAFDEAEKIYQSNDRRTEAQKRRDRVTEQTEQRRSRAAQKRANAEEKNARQANTARAGNEEKRLQQAQQKRMRAEEKAAREAGKGQNTGANAQPQDMAAQLQAASAAREAATAQLLAAMQQLTAGEQQLGATLNSILSVVNSGISALSSRIAQVNAELANLKATVNRLQSKL